MMRTLDALDVEASRVKKKYDPNLTPGRRTGPGRSVFIPDGP
ncbi:hypothetical protein [Achromobacter spanius]